MDPSIQFLLGNQPPKAEGATIHPIAPASPESGDDGKIGFTLDVAARLDREQSDEDDHRATVVPMNGSSRPTLADSA